MELELALAWGEAALSISYRHAGANHAYHDDTHPNYHAGGVESELGSDIRLSSRSISASRFQRKNGRHF